MRPIITAAALTAIAATCTSTLAQPFIEIEWVAITDADPDGMVEKFGGRIVLDASAPPSFSKPSLTQFQAVVAESYFEVGPLSPTVPQPEPAEFGYIVYYSQTDNILIGVGFESSQLIFSIDSPASGFMSGMTALPQDPDSYLFAGSHFDTTEAFSLQSTTEWSPHFGFEGGTFRYWVREVENPNPPEPCIADANDDGILDLADINMFVNSFNAGCP